MVELDGWVIACGAGVVASRIDWYIMPASSLCLPSAPC